MQNKSIKKNTILNMFRMALTVLVPLVTFPYTSRIFLADGNGQLSFASSVVQIFTLFASLGIYTYGVREGSKVRNDRKEFSKLVYELFSINVIATIITYIVFFISVLFLPSFHDYQTLLIINGFTIGFTALGLDWVYGVYEEYSYITIRQIIIQIFIIVSMFLFVHEAKDIYLWAILSAFSGVGANIFNFFHARKYVSLNKWTGYGGRLTKHVKPIIILFATQLASRVYSNLDMILLGMLTTDYNTGIYSASVKINTILITCFTAMSPVFMPRIVEFIRDRRNEEYFVFLKKIFRMIIGLGLPTVIGIEMLSKQIIVILAGKSFQDAAITMRILAPIIMISTCTNILYYNVMVPLKKEKYVLICTGLAAGINLIFSILLIPQLLHNGAAVGSLLSESLALFAALIFCYRLDKKIFEGFPNIMNYLIGGAAIVAWCLLCEKIVRNMLIQTIIAVIGSVIVYGLILLIKKDAMADEGIKIMKKICKIQD